MEIAGEGDSVAAAIYQELARVVRSQRGDAVALPMLDTSLVRLRRSLGAAHGDVAQAMQEVAFVTGDTLRRRVLLDSALALRLRAGATDSLRLAESLSAQGNELLRRARAREAVPFFQAALALLEELQPPDHPQRLGLTQKLAMALDATGEYQRAEVIARSLLERRERAGMTESPRMASTIGAVAMLAAHQGRLEQAETMLRKALAMFGRVQDPAHVSNQNALRDLGLVISARGRVADGLELLDSALVLARAHEGGGQASYIQGQRIPALLRMGRLAEAKAALAAAEASFNGGGPPTRPRRLDVESWAGAVALARGDAPHAAVRFANALHGYRALYAPTHHKVAGSECGLGIALATQRRFEEAAPLLQSGCPVYEQWGMAEPFLVEWGQQALQLVTAGKLVAVRFQGREEMR
jgi:tetratricopeptide (TPR) repeat protein